MECLHPIANTATAPFRLTACSPDADRAALTGELDHSTLELLTWALDAADLRRICGRRTAES